MATTNHHAALAKANQDICAVADSKLLKPGSSIFDALIESSREDMGVRDFYRDTEVGVTTTGRMVEDYVQSSSATKGDGRVLMTQKQVAERDAAEAMLEGHGKPSDQVKQRPYVEMDPEKVELEQDLFIYRRAMADFTIDEKNYSRSKATMSTEDFARSGLKAPEKPVISALWQDKIADLAIERAIQPDHSGKNPLAQWAGPKEQQALIESGPVRARAIRHVGPIGPSSGLQDLRRRGEGIAMEVSRGGAPRQVVPGRVSFPSGESAESIKAKLGFFNEVLSEMGGKKPAGQDQNKGRER